MDVILDRRQHRTREAIRQAFITLATSRRYEDFSVSDLVSVANIGRSTFYEHYRSKDELLRALMDGMLALLADASAGKVPPEKLRGLLVHFWGNRRLGKAVFGPQLGPAVRRRMAELIEGRTGVSKARAVYVAGAQIGLLFAWLSGEVPADLDEIGDLLLSRSPAAG